MNENHLNLPRHEYLNLPRHKYLSLVSLGVNLYSRLIRSYRIVCYCIVMSIKRFKDSFRSQ